MSLCKITLLGLYEFDNDLFVNLTMPTITVPADHDPVVVLPSKDTLVSVILEKSADFPALYPDVDFMKFMIGVWAKNCEYMMRKLWETQMYNYNPIYNYDKTGSISRTSSASSGGTVTGSQTAFNTDSFKDTGKTVSSDSASGSETITESAAGNIGVTSTMQLLQEQRELSMFKWYDIVSDDFINKFCVQIY